MRVRPQQTENGFCVGPSPIASELPEDSARPPPRRTRRHSQSSRGSVRARRDVRRRDPRAFLVHASPRAPARSRSIVQRGDDADGEGCARSGADRPQLCKRGRDLARAAQRREEARGLRHDLSGRRARQQGGGQRRRGHAGVGKDLRHGSEPGSRVRSARRRPGHPRRRRRRRASAPALRRVTRMPAVLHRRRGPRRPSGRARCPRRRSAADSSRRTRAAAASRPGSAAVRFRGRGSNQRVGTHTSASIRRTPSPTTTVGSPPTGGSVPATTMASGSRTEDAGTRARHRGARSRRNVDTRPLARRREADRPDAGPGGAGPS